MAGKWPYKRVEEIALKIAMGPFGSSIKVETFTDSGIPIISGQHLREAQVTDGEFNFIKEAHADSLKNANVQRGDVIFTHAGNIGQVAFIPDDSAYQRYVISQRQFYLRCNTDLMLPEFITYYFKTPEGQHRLLANANQVGVPSIARPSSYLKTIEVPAPSIEEQQVVVRNIKALDAKIRLNIGINQTIEAMAQAIFKSWFVDFEPVKAKVAAKQEGRDPLRAAMSAISGKTNAELDAPPPEQYAQLAATATLFPDEMGESKLGEIPKGWIVSDMRTLAEVISKGTTPNKSDLANAKDVPTVPFVKVKDISEDGEIARGNLELIARSIHESSLKRSILKTDDLLFSIAGTIGRTAFVDNDLNGANVNQAIAFIRLNDKLDHFALCWLTLRSIETKNFIASKVVQAVQANASLANVGDIPVRLPGNDVLKKWNGVVSPLILEYRARLGEIRTLATLRDTLLPKLMSGELSVTALAESAGVA